MTISGSLAATPPVTLAVVDDRLLTIYEASPRGLVKQRSVDVGAAADDDMYISEVVWTSQDEVALLLHASDPGPADAPAMPRVLTVRGETIRQVPLPDASAWDVPGDGSAERMADRHTLVATTDGELWLGMCAWGYRGDDDPCTKWSYVRLPPKRAKHATRAPRKARAPQPWKPVQAPTGYRIEVEQLDEDRQRMTCIDPTGKQVTPKGQDGAFTIDVSWISATPPIYRARLAVPGADDAVYVTLMYQACEATPLHEDYDEPHFGPAPYWTVKSDEGMDAWLVYLGGIRVGRINNASVRPAFGPHP